LFVLLASIAAVPAGAQTTAGRLEVAAGLRWLGGTAYAEVPAVETSRGNGQFVLFNSNTELKATAGVEARVGVRLTPVLTAEGGLSYSRPRLETRVSSDAESIPNVAVGESVAQYAVEAGLTAQLARWRVGRMMPFAAGGGGYLRQLHAGRQLVETGRTYYVGGGFRYPLTERRRGLVRSSGLRADVRAAGFKNGVALDDKVHWVPSLSASLFVTF
jgi:hypothetical protein